MALGSCCRALAGVEQVCSTGVGQVLDRVLTGVGQHRCGDIPLTGVLDRCWIGVRQRGRALRSVVQVFNMCLTGVNMCCTGVDRCCTGVVQIGVTGVVQTGVDRCCTGVDRCCTGVDRCVDRCCTGTCVVQVLYRCVDRCVIQSGACVAGVLNICCTGVDRCCTGVVQTGVDRCCTGVDRCCTGVDRY
ncbi:hypothetical protein Hamer_G014990 [Homarus americanus]|uniref:Uncharacterized protein n=1 Tax=Homarus americanus TaxID=6706 RepID=A0A8J5MKD5_HOMAM|nr:hypothetical protein Hamer_G014990 [Homarus americanus]